MLKKKSRRDKDVLDFLNKWLWIKKNHITFLKHGEVDLKKKKHVVLQGWYFRNLSEPCQSLWPGCNGELLDLPLGLLGRTCGRWCGSCCPPQVREVSSDWTAEIRMRSFVTGENLLTAFLFCFRLVLGDERLRLIMKT